MCELVAVTCTAGRQCHAAFKACVTMLLGQLGSACSRPEPDRHALHLLHASERFTNVWKEAGQRSRKMCGKLL